MALASDVPKESFRLSMLIYDTRYRSITIQIFVLVLFGLFLAWLLNNTAQNLATRGKEFNFGFLWQRAGYDIGQQLIPYTNDSNHFRALLVGLINTLVVAIIGCVLATVIGVFVGVMRLSKNWLVGRLMTVYVEMFRNVPLLLWILLSYVILSETTPQPRDFRLTDEMAAAGEAPAASMILFDTVAVTNRGTNVPSPLFDRSLGTLDLGGMSISLTLLAYIAVIAGSVWVNRRILAAARAQQEATGDRPVTWWKSLAVLFVPVIALSAALGLHLEIPELRGFNFQGGILVAHSFTALVIALALYTAAFIAEIVRAGILAISRGQSEAAFALGLRPGRTMNLIILPQALRVIIPPLISQYLNLTKNTSLGIAVSYLDLRGTLGGITLNQTGRELECMLLMMLIYLTISLIISAVMNLYNKSVQIKAR
ncbi:ABC transporter permease subunit [Rhodobacter sp. HX-7-19]|uniref:ABC transporter permease subunit n=1 Tax=Paragemmobacter kunshanensis TaxID=2583234 RepID=A0A6M1TZW6_9RHOB|nr:ABC transporter permease subunit [Rhodobacter kunshanensis]NGQ90764.1 ABC transporter permease subunit [Rhodobacter kunshanensis]